MPWHASETAPWPRNAAVTWSIVLPSRWSGVDINTIRAWLGHVSLTTTNVYAEVDLEMKAKALANCEVEGQENSGPWKEDKGLMEFLRKL